MYNDVTTRSLTLSCAQIGYRYRDRIMSNIRTTPSIGNPAFDAKALAEATQGKLAKPMARMDRAVIDFTVPVCRINQSDSGQR